VRYAYDFRAQARQTLGGHWFPAILAGFCSALLSGTSFSGFSSVLRLFITRLTRMDAGTLAFLLALLVPLAGVILVFSLLRLTLGCIVWVGYAYFNLNLYDGQEPRPGDLFSHYSNFKTLLCSQLLVLLYTFLWSLLLIVPGIIAGYSYAMTPFLLAEYPDLTASEALSLSKEIMRGNRWRLFCLHLSFIGWQILSSFTMGIGGLFLRPYIAAAETAFYRDLSLEPLSQTPEIL